MEPRRVPHIGLISLFAVMLGACGGGNTGPGGTAPPPPPVPPEFNTVRPHEWLNQDTPASRYIASPRVYPTRMPPLEYPGHFLVKKVTTGGTFRFQHKLLYIANSLVDHHIGLEETDDGIWSIYFNTVLIATLDERDYIIRG